MQVKYPAAQPQLPLGLTGATFAALFGANQSPLESMVLKRRLMGPSWLAAKQPRKVTPEAQVRRQRGAGGGWCGTGASPACASVGGRPAKGVRQAALRCLSASDSPLARTPSAELPWLQLLPPAQVSWCKLEVEVEGHKAVGPLPGDGAARDAPPLTVAALHVQTAVAPGGAANEIVAASVVYLQGVRSDGPMAQVGGQAGVGGKGEGDIGVLRRSAAAVRVCVSRTERQKEGL